MKRINPQDCINAIKEQRIILELNGHKPTTEDSRLAIAQRQLESCEKEHEGAMAGEIEHSEKLRKQIIKDMREDHERAMRKKDQDIIFWRGLLESVMCEIYADGLTEETEGKVMTALKEKNEPHKN